MFTIRTTIVLGAGASYGYGYPLGHDLLDRMIKAAVPDEDLLGSQGFHGRNQPEVILARNLKFYDPISIDAHLSHYTDGTLLTAGKRLIAEVILNAANSKKFNRPKPPRPSETAPPPHHWYRYLWDAIVRDKSPEELVAQDYDLNFEIITFNYDPSLEFYLYSRVTDHASIFKQNQQHQFLEKLRSRVHHVYGCIRAYRWFGGDDPNEHYQCEPQDIPYLVPQCAERIQLIDSRKMNQYDHLQAKIRWAEQVIFLGFAFDETNIGPDVLDLKNTLTPIREEAGFRKFKIIKYTNYNNIALVSSRIEEVTSRRYDMPPGFTMLKSTKSVYGAVSEDFSLNHRY